MYTKGINWQLQLAAGTPPSPGLKLPTLPTLPTVKSTVATGNWQLINWHLCYLLVSLPRTQKLPTLPTVKSTAATGNWQLINWQLCYLLVSLPGTQKLPTWLINKVIIC